MEELKAILELLEKTTEAGAWAFGWWLAYKFGTILVGWAGGLTIAALIVKVINRIVRALSFETEVERVAGLDISYPGQQTKLFEMIERGKNAR